MNSRASSTVTPGKPHLIGRRPVLHLAAAMALAPSCRVSAQERRFAIGFANITDDAGTRIEGLGFTGADVRTSFLLGARALPIDLVLFDNGRDRAKAIANAEEAVRRKVDLYIQYCDDPAANEEVARRMIAARIPVLAVNEPVGNAPLYAADNRKAGRLAGDALGKFAQATWRGRLLAAAVVGTVKAPARAIQERVAGVIEGLRQQLPDVVPAQLDSGGDFLEAQGQLRRFLAKESGAMALVATLDDTTALAAKLAAETAGRVPDTVIVSQGCDPSIHGGTNANKPIDANNRNSIVLGSVAYFLDRYGSEVLPLALKILRGEQVPPRTSTDHVLVTAANVFKIYPPIDLN